MARGAQQGGYTTDLTQVAGNGATNPAITATTDIAQVPMTGGSQIMQTMFPGISQISNDHTTPVPVSIGNTSVPATTTPAPANPFKAYGQNMLRGGQNPFFSK
jgi:hypothetical protein